MNNFISASAYTELCIYECGKEECVKDKAIRLTIKNYHLFHYVLHGKGTLVINEKEYRLNKGCLFFIPQNNQLYFPTS